MSFLRMNIKCNICRIVNKKILKNKSFFANVAILVLATAFAQALNIIFMPFIARLYTPSDFGFLAIFIAIGSVVATFITLRYETAILPAKNNEESATVGLLCFICIAIFGILFLILIIISSLFEGYFSFFGNKELYTYLPLSVLMGIMTALASTSQSWMNREKRYGKIAIQRVMQSVLIIIFGILFGFFYKEENGLLFAQIFGAIGALIISIYFSKDLVKFWNIKHVRNVAVLHSNAPKYLLLASLLDVITLQLPIVLIANLYGENLTGQFSMAWRILMLPVALVGGAVGQVFVQRFIELKSDVENAKNIFRKTLIILLCIGFFPMIFLFFFGTEFFEFFLGDAWGGAGKIASIISPMILAMFISSPLSSVYIAMGLQKYNLYFGILVFLYRPLCIYFGYYLDDFFIGLISWVVIDVFVIFFYQLIAYRKIEKFKG